MITADTNEFAKTHPKQFDALPDSYRTDSCLLFWEDKAGEVFAKPLRDQEHMLGRWVCMYNYNANKWEKLSDN